MARQTGQGTARASKSRGAAKGTAKKATRTAKSASKSTAKTTAKASMKAPAKRGTRKAATTGATKSARKLPARKVPGISRVDQDSTRTHGWVVRLNYEQTASGWRPKHTAYFGDATHGGANKSMAAAEDYLKKLQRSERKTKR